MRFVPQQNEADFILYRNVPGVSRCSSPAGRKGGPHEIKCALKATTTDTLRALVHEIGHAIGLQHEHQRLDRDASMAVSKAAEAQRPQDFKVLDGEQMVGPYDLNSVMHYAWSTSTSQRPLTKITPLPPPVWPNPSQPSAGDAEGVNFMYGIVPDRTPIAALRRHAEHMELWVVGGDGVIRGAWWNGAWRTWYQLPERTFPQRGHLAVLGRHRDHMEVFRRRHRRPAPRHLVGRPVARLVHARRRRPSAPTPGTPALPPGAPLAVRSRFTDHMEVWVIGADGQVHHTFWDGSSWQGWFSLSGRSSCLRG